MITKIGDFIVGTGIVFVSALIAASLVYVLFFQKDTSWETDRLLLCTGPTLPQSQRALLAQKIKFNGTYFEVISNGNKYTYLPSKFETCLTLPQPAQAPQVNNSSPELRPLNEESNPLASR